MEALTISTTVYASPERVWELWTKPEHIIQWCAASDDWYVPVVQNDVQPGGRFVFTMAARDGSARFDFGGIYTIVDEPQRLAYTLTDGRKVDIQFKPLQGAVEIIETFEPETENTIQKQQEGWQAILDNFKKYAENAKQ